MQNNRFLVLTGHLNNYPLSDLVGILRHQKKTGRLLIEYVKGPATFFFHDGELVDARFNDLTGLQAICVALAQPDAAFNFNPMIPATRRSIDPSLQRAVSELCGCWDESTLQIETAPTQVSVTTTPVLTTQREPLPLPPAPASGLRQRSLIFMAGAVLAGVGLSTVIAVTGGFSGSPPAAAAEAPRTVVQTPNPSPSASSVQPSRPLVISAKPKARPKPGNTDNTDEKPEAVKVVMQIENGRVLKASIANHKPGMDGYEAMALRIARQRRYAATVSGGQTVSISVSPQQ